MTTLSRDIYKGFPRNNAEDYFDKSLLYTAPYQCRVTYWNGKSVGYSCIGNSGESQPVNYFIGNVAAACKTKIQRLSAQRFGCETTYFNAKWQLNTGDVGPSFDNFKKYWPKSWRHNDNAWRTSPYLVFYPTGLFAKNNMVKGAVTHFYTPYTNFFKVMREVAVKADFGTPGGKDTTHTSSYYPYFELNSNRMDDNTRSYFQADFIGNDSIYNFTILVAYNAAGFSDGNGNRYTEYATFGCKFSDCLIQDQSVTGVTLRYNNGSSYTLQDASSSVSNQIPTTAGNPIPANAIFEITGSQEKASAPWLPGGEWKDKCTDILVSGSWIKARCDGGEVGVAPAWSMVNFGNCSNSGTELSIGKQNQLQCL